jgi:amino acid transporter
MKWNKHCENAKKVAGFGGIVGVLVIVALFLLAQVAIQMALTSDQIQKNAANLLPALGHVALSAPWSAIAVLAVMVSAVATLQTQLLQCTRLLFSMARDGVIGEPMGWLHPRFQTPCSRALRPPPSRFSCSPPRPRCRVLSN